MKEADERGIAHGMRDPAGMLVVAEGGSYVYLVVDDSDLAEPDPPIWVLVESGEVTRSGRWALLFSIDIPCPMLERPVAKGASVRTESPVRAALSAISPLFVVSDLQQVLTFYREHLGFEVTHQAPATDPFFAIVVRDGVQLMLKVVAENVGALPNRSRHPYARWDAYVHVPDPDALAAEFRDRGVTFTAPLTDTVDGLRGFELTDHDGYLLFFGRPASDAP